MKLDTESGLIEGHNMCASYLEEKARELLWFQPILILLRKTVFLVFLILFSANMTMRYLNYYQSSRNTESTSLIQFECICWVQRYNLNGLQEMLGSVGWKCNRSY